MNPFEMVVIIVAIVTIGGIIRAKHRLPAQEETRDDRAETLQLREDVRALKERIKVLERIAVDKEDTLARQIDDLRDR